MTQQEYAAYIARRAWRSTSPAAGPERTDKRDSTAVGPATHSTRFEVRDVPASELARTLANVEAQGGVIARLECVWGRNAAWRLRIHWPNGKP